MKILVINSGSSSLKYQLIDMENENLIAKGNCERIGINGSFIKFTHNNEKNKLELELNNHNDAINQVLSLLTSKEYGVINSLEEITAVGHRVLHGAEIFKEAVLVDDNVLKVLEELKPFGPLHMPANIAGILACQKAMPNTKNVAVFDTAFHSKMPKKAFLYAIPYNAYTDWKLRKYGFHGTSHQFLLEETAKVLNKNKEDIKIITCHIGNGSSIAAISGGHTVDTSMGFTPLEGLIMGSRSGDIDPAIIEVIMDKTGMNIHETINYLNKKSGMLGISGLSSDCRDLEEAEATNEMAKLALDAFVYRIVKYVGSYMSVLNGADAIIFTGGIGENMPRLREEVAKSLAYCGVKIDVDKNNNLGRDTIEEISTSDSTVKLFRIPTNEELSIARQTKNLI